MKLQERKSIKIGDKDYPLQMSVRAFIMYENLSGNPMHVINTLENRIQLFYSCIKVAGNEITYDEFLNIIDDKMESLVDFFKIFNESQGNEKKPEAQ